MLPFIHLRARSAYSLSEGAIMVESLPKLAKENRMPAVAVTDTGNMFGALEFSMKCASLGVQPILGCVIRLVWDESSPASRLPLIAKSEAGLSNLFKLASHSYLESASTDGPAITLQELAAHAEELIALTGALEGPIGMELLQNRFDEAEQKLLALRELFGDRLYIELQRHGLQAENRTEPIFLQLAGKHGIPIVATNDAYFPDPGFYEAHDALLCIADGRYVAEEDRRKVTPEHYFKSSADMAALFADLPEALENSFAIARRCAAMAKPRDPILPKFADDENELLRRQAYKGLCERLGLAPEPFAWQQLGSPSPNPDQLKPYFDRLDYELSVITGMHYSGYFLIVSDFIRWAKAQGIPVGPGRGSGAGSIVAWALLITDLDPLRFGLLFERFLNPDRISMPDFDIDFCQERRDEVIRYVRGKYGNDRVAQIITFGKLQARAALRDVGRVLQMSYSQVDKICKMIPFNPIDPITLSQAINLDPMLQEARDTDPGVAKLLGIGLKLEGLYRHASTHAAGVVIADRPLELLLPVYRDPRSEMPVTGYSMKYAEAAGLVKFDFLGLKTLTVIAEAVKLVNQKPQTRNLESELQTSDFRFLISDIPLNDPATYRLLSQGHTAGIFQMESSGMRDALRKLRPDCIEDIIALISLYRPGPMENIPAYITRKHGREKPDYLHPSLEPTLKETFGVMIYQEQVMQIAQVLAGYSLAAADLLRRAMGKKIKTEMDAQEKQFIEGAKNNGVPEPQAREIFELVAKFAGYGFNKSHAAAYALIGYQTAYLKANYPAQFLTASLNLDIGDTDKINLFREEAARLGISLLPPDVNRSGAYFSVETSDIRYGLSALKGVGMQAMQAIAEEREANGAFKDIFDIAARLDRRHFNKRQLESLAKAGAFDSIHSNRRQIFEEATLLARFNTSAQESRESTQVSLFGDNSAQISNPALKDVPDWGTEEKMHAEFEALGFYLTQHPLSFYEEDIRQMGATKASDLLSASDRSKVKLAGIITNATHRATGKKRFTYLQLSDPTGLMEVAVFDEALISTSRDLIESKKPVLIVANARKDEGGTRLIAESITLLDAVLNKARSKICIELRDGADLAKLQGMLGQLNQGSMTLSLRLAVKNGEGTEQVEIALPGTYDLSRPALSQLASLTGIEIKAA